MVSSAWANRIIGHGELAPDTLISQNQQEPFPAVLEPIGWVQDIIINVRSGDKWPLEDRNIQTVVEGHLKIMLAVRYDQPKVLVKFVDLSPSEEALFLVTVDPLFYHVFLAGE